MEALFLKLLNMSITASWLVLAVILLRLLLKKAPKWLTVSLWSLVALRLVFPFSIESIFSLIPSAEPIPQDIVYSPAPTINTGIDAFNTVVNPIISESLAPTPSDSANPLQIVSAIATAVWLAGICVMLTYSLVSYLYLRKKVSVSLKKSGNIYYCDNVDTPFILGVISPRVYLPSGLSDSNAAYVIRHEEAHLKRLDHLWKPLGFAILSVYWFNPVLWIAYILLCRDIELACDERVIKDFDTHEKKGYSRALVECSVHRRTVLACPLAFGEVGVKGRIKSVLNYKKPAFWIIVAALIASIVLAVCFLTDPYKDDSIDKIAYQKGYTIIEQTDYELTLTIPQSVISDKAYTEEGLHFDDDQVVAYQNDTTKIYLESIYPVSGSSDTVWLNFDMSYDNLDKSNIALTAYKIGDNSSSFTPMVYLPDNILRDDVAEYENAVKKGSSGPSNRFGLYATTEVLKKAIGSIKIKIICNQVEYEKNSNSLKNDELPERLSVFLDVEIHKHHGGFKNATSYKAMDFEVLDTRTKGDEITVYCWVLYNEYTYKHGLQLESSAHTLTAITVKRVKDYYELVNYWEPRDGSYYDDDIRSKLPLSVQLKARDHEKYYDLQLPRVEQMANAYYNSVAYTYVNIGNYPDGTVLLYDGPTPRGAAPVIQATNKFTSLEMSSFLELLKKQKWINYNTTDRPDIQLNGCISNDVPLFFGYTQRVVFYSSYYCIADDEVMAVLRGLTKNATPFFGTSRSGECTTIGQLKQKAPELFKLDAKKGLTVYVWQMAINSYSCAVYEGKNTAVKSTELMQAKSLSLSEARLVLSYYGLDEKDVRVMPTALPHSSYLYERNASYVNRIKEMVFYPYAKITVSPDRIMDEAVLDIDGDGIDEICYLTSGITSGVFTFMIEVIEKGSEHTYDYSTLFRADHGKISLEVTDNKLQLRYVPNLKENPLLYQVVPTVGIQLELIPDESNDMSDYENEPIQAGIYYSYPYSGQPTLQELKVRFPEYFGLSTKKMMSVYVWQTGENDYYCGLMEYTDDPGNAPLNLKPATFEEMRVILSSYDVTKKDVVLKPIFNPSSGYYYTVDDEYTQKVNSMFWKES